MTDSGTETVIKEYAYGYEIVEEEREDDYNRYHYQGPMGLVKILNNPDKA